MNLAKLTTEARQALKALPLTGNPRVDQALVNAVLDYYEPLKEKAAKEAGYNCYLDYIKEQMGTQKS